MFQPASRLEGVTVAMIHNGNVFRCFDPLVCLVRGDWPNKVSVSSDKLISILWRRIKLNKELVQPIRN
jgi:hypothetical protein